MRSKGDGLYSCSYTPASALKHTVAVSWAGVSIPKSPFRVSSQSQHPVSTGSGPALPTSEHQAGIEATRSEPLVITESCSGEAESQRTGGSRRAKKLLIIMTTVEESFLF